MGATHGRGLQPAVRALSIALALSALTIVSCSEPPDSRGGPRVDISGDPLPDSAVARCGTLRFRCPQTLTHLAYSRDGKRILGIGTTSTYDWDSATGKVLKVSRIVPGKGHVASVATVITLSSD